MMRENDPIVIDMKKVHGKEGQKAKVARGKR